MKKNVAQLPVFLNSLSRDFELIFYVISAAPREVVLSALDQILPPERVFGTRLEYDSTGEICGVLHSTAGYGKVTVLKGLQEKHQVSQDHLIYVGDGSSDIHVMLHVNRLDGYTIAVSENLHIQQVARRAILSDNALAVSIPLMQEILGWNQSAVRKFLDGCGFVVKEWEKLQTDALMLEPECSHEAEVLRAVE